VTYTLHYLEPGEGLDFQRYYRDPNLEADEAFAIDTIRRESEELGETPLQIEHGNKIIWQDRDVLLERLDL